MSTRRNSTSSEKDMDGDTVDLAAEPIAGFTLSDFSRWMSSEQKRIFLLCLRILRNVDDADMATQDTFLKSYEELKKGKTASLGSPAAWLTRVAVNTCLDTIRSRRWKFWRRRLPHTDEQTVLLLSAAPAPSPEDETLSRQIAGRISLALGRLSLRQRSVFILRHEEGKSLEEIAEILNLEVGTVKVHMSRAVLKLRQELREFYAGKALE